MKRPPSAKRWAQRGFTILEILVSFVILSTAMLIASRLLVESQVRMAHSARKATDPVAFIALKQIRADVRMASAIGGPGSGWTWDPLVLGGHPAGIVRYEKIGSDLVRKLQGGEEDAARIVMHSVAVWRWRVSPEAPLDYVEIELGYRETPRLGLLTSGGVREAIPSLKTLRIAVSPRQARDRRGW